MDDKDLTNQLLETFVGELDEHIRSMNEDLMALERAEVPAERKDLIQRLFRTVHTLKGASRTVNVTEVEQVFHRIEGILGGVRDGARELGAENLDLLFLVVDALQSAGERLRRRQTLAGGPLAALLPRLDEAAGLATSPGPHAATPPPVAPRAAAPAATNPPPPPAAPASPAPVAELPHAPEGPEEYRSARVPVEKLDRLLGRHDELLLASRRVAAQVGELQQLHEFVQRWQRTWRGLRPFLEKLEGPAEAAPLGTESHRHPRNSRNARSSKSPQTPPGNPNPHDSGAGGAPAQHRVPGANTVLPPSVARALGRADEDLRYLERRLSQASTGLVGDTHALKQAADSLSDGIGSLRMMPFSEACAGLARLARDTAVADGKDVTVVINSGDVEMDRAIIQKLKGPLIQLVRNAVAHGIEPPGLRRARKKPEQGLITVAAEVRGSHVEVTVSDDGGGLPTAAIREKARSRGMPEPTDSTGFVNLVFHPGFSTAPAVTEFSGRGVGLDVVKTELESLHATIDLWFAPERGTRFTLSLPLTLTVTRGLTVSAAGRVFALVGTNVRQVLRIDPAAFRLIDGRECLITGRAPIPVADLGRALGIGEDRQAPRGATVSLVVVAAGDRQMAFVVDDLLAERELVVRSLGRRLKRVHNIAGAFQLENGEVGLALNASELIRGVLGRETGQRLAQAVGAPAAATRRHILVAEDSITTRTLEKMILQSAGYDVTLAKDGAEAWDLLQLRGADLVVSDIEMPGLTGFELTQRIRGSKRFGDVPVVLVTSRSSDEDKARGAEVGATAYLVKSSFDQAALLKTIARLL